MGFIARELMMSQHLWESFDIPSNFFPPCSQKGSGQCRYCFVNPSKFYCLFFALSSTVLRLFFDCSSEILRFASLFLRPGFGNGTLFRLNFSVLASAAFGSIRRNSEQRPKKGLKIAVNDTNLPHNCLPSGKTLNTKFTISGGQILPIRAKLCQTVPDFGKGKSADHICGVKGIRGN